MSEGEVDEISPSIVRDPKNVFYVKDVLQFVRKCKMLEQSIL